MRRRTRPVVFTVASSWRSRLSIARPNASCSPTPSPHRRPRPHLDDKTIVAWNGLMISALARGGSILDEPRYTAAAAKAAAFIRNHLYDPKTHTLTRIYRDGPAGVGGFLDDYAFYRVAP